MGSCADEGYSVFLFVDMPDQEPVMLDVTFPVIVPFAAELMCSVVRVDALFLN